MRRVSLYTDGGAEPNPGIGGWGAVAVFDDGADRMELSGGTDHTTNNRMELTAAIEGLEALPEAAEVDLYTDSIYLRRGITEWLEGWRRAGWRRGDGRPVKNVDLWRRLAELAARRRVRWHWVRGHAGHEYNERADALASAEIARRREASRKAADAAQEEGEQGAAADVVVLLKVRAAGGRGAWAALVAREGEERELSGVASNVTANRLELLAVVEILRSLPADVAVEVRGGSEVLRQGASSWLPEWRRSGWRTKSGDEVKNVDLWRELARQLRKRSVRWVGSRSEDSPGLRALGRRLRERMRGE